MTHIPAGFAACAAANKDFGPESQDIAFCCLCGSERQERRVAINGFCCLCGSEQVVNGPERTHYFLLPVRQRTWPR